MYYLIDQNKKVKGAYKTLKGIPINGFRILNVPDAVAIDHTDIQDTPPILTYADLIRQKYEGILANNPEFSSVLYDDLEDASGWNTGESSSFGVGDGVYWVKGSSSHQGNLRTNTLNLPGPASRFKLLWEVYRLDRTTQEGFNTVEYLESSSDVLQSSISTESANPFVAVFNDEPITLPPGDSIRVEFESPSSTTRYYIGGFALLY